MRFVRTVILCVSLLLWLGPVCTCKADAADSLLRLLSKADKDSSRINVLHALFLEYEFNDPEKAKSYLKQAFEIAISSDYQKGLAKSYIYLGYFAQDKSNAELAIQNYNEALKIYQKIKDKNGIAWAINNIGISYFELSEYSKALDYFFKGLKMSEEVGDKQQISTKLANIGSVYLRQNNYPLALEYYLKTLRIDEELGDPKEIAIVNGNIGVVYTNMDQHEKALEYYTRAWKIDVSLDNKYGIATQLDNMGIAYSDLAEMNKEGSAAYDSLLKEALVRHREALKLNLELENPNRTASCYNNMSTVYYDLFKSGENYNMLDSALFYLSKALKINEETGNMDGVTMGLGNMGSIYTEYGKYEKAEEYLKKTLTASLKYGFLETRSQCYLQFTELYERMKQPEKALAYFKRHTELKDSIFNETKSQQIAEMQTRFEVEKKEKELALFRQDQKLTKYKAYFLAAILFLVSLLAAVLINRQRIKIKKQKEAYDLEQQLANTEIERGKLEKQNLEANLLINQEKLNRITDMFREKSKLMDKMQEQLDKTAAEDVQEGEVKNLINSIAESIDPNEYWEEFITSFNLVNKSFFEQIQKKFPDLTRNELRLCALIKCNLGNKEMANILNITPDSVKKSRNRLRKRLQLEADDSLTKYIQFLN